MINSKCDKPVKSTLILSPRNTSDTTALNQAAIDKSWKIERTKNWRISENFKIAENFAVYGEGLFGAVICQQIGISLVEPTFDWLANLPNKYKLREVEFVSLKDAKKIKKRSFVKPADDKCFPAKVYENGAELKEFSSLQENTPVLISEPVKWNSEFRFFIADGEIKTFSPYSRNGALIQNENGQWLATIEENQKAFELCQSLIENEPDLIPPAVVIDIGEIENKGWAVVEANSCWASGIYGCNPLKVLEVIDKACIKNENLDENCSKWIIKRGE